MYFTALTVVLTLAAHITRCTSAYSVTAYNGQACNLEDPAIPSITVVGSNTNTPVVKSCFPVSFQGQSISVTGCTSGGTVTPFTDGNCITPASVAIPDTGISCLESISLKSFSVTGC